MITDDQPINPVQDDPLDVLDDTISRLRELVRVLTDQENQMAAELAALKQKRVGAERALGVFTGTKPRKPRGRPRKQAD